MTLNAKIGGFMEFWRFRAATQDILQQGKSGIVINKDMGNMQHRPKAWDWQTGHTHTEENVVTVDEMVGFLNHKGQKQTYHSIRQISKKTDLKIQSVASYRSFTAFSVRSVFCLPTHLLSITVSFSCIYISQGSVQTQLTCGGIFNTGNHFIANCLQNASVKKF